MFKVGGAQPPHPIRDKAVKYGKVLLHWIALGLQRAVELVICAGFLVLMYELLGGAIPFVDAGVYGAAPV